MNWLLAVGVASFLGGVLLAVGIWQHRIRKAQDRLLLAQLRESAAHGAEPPVGQYPHINPYLCLGCFSCVRACIEGNVLAVVEGRARLVHPAHCIGDGHCQEVCPVGALTVGLGDIRSRPDIPILSGELETSVPGVFIAGELGGIALIRHAMQQGSQVMRTIGDRLRSPGAVRHGPGPSGVLIVGCGPAGLAAALQARDLGIRHMVIDQNDLGGTVLKYPRNKLTMTQPIQLPFLGRLKRPQYTKEELLSLWEAAVRKAGIEVRPHVTLMGLQRQPDQTLLAETSAGRIHCRYVILALGRRGTPRRLGVPGEESDHVLYQLADAAGYTHKDILVVGGGDSAIEAATALAVQPGNRVRLSYRRPAFSRIKQRNEERITTFQAEGRVEVLFNSQVKSIQPGSAVVRVEEAGNIREISVRADYVFVLAGGEPPYPLLKKIGIRFHAENEPQTQCVGDPKRDVARWGALPAGETQKA
jgi:thioredoxin reductase/Pyruvate/2-oxoacid:ferredoxin oxidoreductase delta subunit